MKHQWRINPETETASCDVCGQSERMSYIVQNPDEVCLQASLPIRSFPHDKPRIDFNAPIKFRAEQVTENEALRMALRFACLRVSDLDRRKDHDAWVEHYMELGRRSLEAAKHVR